MPIQKKMTIKLRTKLKRKRMPREIKKISNVKCSYNQKNWNVDNIVNDVSGVLYTSAYYTKKKI